MRMLASEHCPHFNTVVALVWHIEAADVRLSVAVVNQVHRCLNTACQLMILKIFTNLKNF